MSSGATKFECYTNQRLVQESYCTTVSDNCCGQERACADDEAKVNLRGFNSTSETLQCGNKERSACLLCSCFNSGSVSSIDAILGLRELFEDHSDLVVPSLTPLLNGCVRLVADEVWMYSGVQSA